MIKKHEEKLEKLKHYLDTTPKEEIEKEIREIKEREIEGTTAEEFFQNLEQFYRNDDGKGTD